MAQTNPGARPPLDEMLRKEREILQLRASGMTWSDVGRTLGMDRANAHKIGIRALARDHSEAVDDLRRVEGETLNRLQRVAMAQAIGGDLRAMDRVVRLMERRARLFGLDAPQKVEVTSEVDEAIKALAAELGAVGLDPTLPPLDT